MDNSQTSNWVKARDFEAGQEIVKAKRTEYLPAIASEDLYNRYLARALFFEVVPKTKSSMLGLVYRKDPDFELTTQTQFLEMLADNKGATLYTFAKNVLSEAINPARVGILVDIGLDGLPYLSLYKAENIVDWRTQFIEGKEILTALKLAENIVAGTEMFGGESAVQYRILFLENGVYKVRVTDANDKVLSEVTPAIRGGVMPFIPFVFINGNGSLDPAPCRPILMPIINVNESHFRSSADLEHARHYSAMPQLCLCGFQAPENGVRKLGSSVVLETSDVQAKAFFIPAPEIAPLERALVEKEKQMAVLGANLFMDQVASTATEALLRNTASNSTLTNVVVGCSDGMTQALNFADILAGGQGGQCKYEYNTAFYNQAINPAEVVALTNAYQQGMISQDTYLKRLGAMEVLPVGKSVDDEIADIAKGKASASVALVTPTGTEKPAPVVGTADNINAQDVQTV